jgi:hypothetical protein
MSKLFAPGIHHNVPMADYLAYRALSSGVVNTLLMRSAFHAKFDYDNPDSESSTEADIGTAIHAALLEGLDVIEKIIPEMYPAKNGNAPAGWTNPAIRAARDAARAAGKVPLLPEAADRVTDAVIAVRGQLARTELAGCFDLGAPEATVIWDEHFDTARDPETVTQIECRARPDWLSAAWHVSVKTTDGSAQPDGWIRRQLGPNGYDVALAFYERGLHTTGWAGQSRILVIEQNPPFRISVIGLAPSRQQYAEARADRAIRAWADGLRTGVWPAYSARTAFAELEPWLEAQDYEQALLARPEVSGVGPDGVIQA